MQVNRPLTPDPKKQREWLQRSQQRAIAKLREKGAKLAPQELGRSKPIVRRASPKLPPAHDGRSNAVAKRATSRPKHNDSPWRAQVMALHGEACKNCGDMNHVEADHVIPKSQRPQYRAEVRNGLPLCGAFSRNTPGGCHPAKTAGTLQFEFEWFREDQIAFFREADWVDWDADGQPFGAGMKHFRPRTARPADMKGGPYGEE